MPQRRPPGTWGCPACPHLENSVSPTRRFHHWVGGGGNSEVGGPTSVWSLLLLPFLGLLVILPCLPAPLQPRVCVPAARNPGLGHRGATGAVWTVRCCLLPSGASRGHPPTQSHWPVSQCSRTCTCLAFPTCCCCWDLQLGTGLGRACGVVGGAHRHPCPHRAPSTVPGWPRELRCSWWMLC